ncbi:hypothetical protein C8R45DRAFT_1183862 [Mycena sanguinolenta]|nr:hypothetical protein C8R45DRAFT_1183862 [Mycena sanguinolenta]
MSAFALAPGHHSASNVFEECRRDLLAVGADAVTLALCFVRAGPVRSAISFFLPAQSTRSPPIRLPASFPDHESGVPRAVCALCTPFVRRPLALYAVGASRRIASTFRPPRLLPLSTLACAVVGVGRRRFRIALDPRLAARRLVAPVCAAGAFGDVGRKGAGGDVVGILQQWRLLLPPTDSRKRAGRRARAVYTLLILVLPLSCVILTVPVVPSPLRDCDGVLRFVIVGECACAGLGVDFRSFTSSAATDYGLTPAPSFSCPLPPVILVHHSPSRFLLWSFWSIAALAVIPLRRLARDRRSYASSSPPTSTSLRRSTKNGRETLHDGSYEQRAEDYLSVSARGFLPTISAEEAAARAWCIPIPSAASIRGSYSVVRSVSVLRRPITETDELEAKALVVRTQLIGCTRIQAQECLCVARCRPQQAYLSSPAVAHDFAISFPRSTPASPHLPATCNGATDDAPLPTHPRRSALPYPSASPATCILPIPTLPREQSRVVVSRCARG